MVDFICPCCGEFYKLDGDQIPAGTKLSCGACGKKIIYFENNVYVFAFEVSGNEKSHIAACPHCSAEYEFPRSVSGFCECTYCRKEFFMDSVLPPWPAVTPAVPAAAEQETAPVEEEVAPVFQETAPVEEEVAPAVDEGTADYAETYCNAVSEDNPTGNPLLDFGSGEQGTIQAAVPFQQQNSNINIGISREKSGFSGFLISIAEKLYIKSNNKHKNLFD